MAEQYTPATGKRKSAIAQVRLVPGQGKIEINGKEFYQVFTRQEHRRQVLQPFVATETMGKFDIKVKVTGGGLTGQAGGIRHGIARALAKFNESYKPLLRGKKNTKKTPPQAAPQPPPAPQPPALFGGARAQPFFQQVYDGDRGGV